MTMSHSRTMHVSTGDELRALWREARTGRRRRAAGPIALALPGLSEAESNARATRLNKAYFACGCAEATAAGLAGIVAFALWANVAGGDRPLWQTLLLGLGAFFVAGGVGMWVGRRRADAALRREVEAAAKAAGVDLGRAHDAHGAACAVH